jgi:hypothetical protein
MVRQSDQEGALLLSNVSRPGNRCIRAPNQALNQKEKIALLRTPAVDGRKF